MPNRTSRLRVDFTSDQLNSFLAYPSAMRYIAVPIPAADERGETIEAIPTLYSSNLDKDLQTSLGKGHKTTRVSEQNRSKKRREKKVKR